MCAGRQGCRPVRASIPPDRPVVGNRVRNRPDGKERVGAVDARGSGRGGAPRALPGPGRRRAGRRRSARHRARRRRSARPARSSTRPWTQADRRPAVPRARRRTPVAARPGRRRVRARSIGRTRGRGVREGVDEHGEAERVRPEDELLAALVGDPARLRQQPEPVLPLLLRQTDLDREGMEVVDEALRERAQPLVLAAVEARNHGRRDVLRCCSPVARCEPRLNEATQSLVLLTRTRRVVQNHCTRRAAGGKHENCVARGDHGGRLGAAGRLRPTARATASRNARRRSRRPTSAPLLLFDPNNIRYVTSRRSATWARDKNIRFALVPRGGDPILWDFGSAAHHHQLYARGCPSRAGARGVADARRHGATRPASPTRSPRYPRRAVRAGPGTASRSASTSPTCDDARSRCRQGHPRSPTRSR